MAEPGANLYIPVKWNLNRTLRQLNTKDVSIFGTVPLGLWWGSISPSTKPKT